MGYDPVTLDLNECISRFAYDSGYYRNNGTAKARAFLPDQQSEVSVFRIDGLGQAEIFDLGDSARGKACTASIELAAAAVQQANLTLEIAEPPVRHAVIVGWPDDHLRLQYQQLLAEAATIRFRPQAKPWPSDSGNSAGK